MSDRALGVTVSLTAIVFFCGVIWGISEAKKEREIRRAELAADCQYLGSRIEKGFGSMTVYRYACGSVVIESGLAPLDD